MKKIVFLIIALFISVVANGQISFNEEKHQYEFKIGEYVFEGKKVFRPTEFKEGLFTIFVDEEEVDVLKDFFVHNRIDICKKYGIWYNVIGGYRNVKTSEFCIRIETADYHKQKVAEEKATEEREKKEKENRISSLNSIFND